MFVDCIPKTAYSRKQAWWWELRRMVKENENENRLNGHVETRDLLRCCSRQEKTTSPHFSVCSYCTCKATVQIHAASRWALVWAGISMYLYLYLYFVGSDSFCEAQRSSTVYLVNLNSCFSWWFHLLAVIFHTTPKWRSYGKPFDIVL